MELKGSYQQASEFEKEKQLQDYLNEREATPEEIEEMEKQEQETKANDS